MKFIVNRNKVGSYYFLVLNRVNQPILRSYHNYQRKSDCERAAKNMSNYFKSTVTPYRNYHGSTKTVL